MGLNPWRLGSARMLAKTRLRVFAWLANGGIRFGGLVTTGRNAPGLLRSGSVYGKVARKRSSAMR
jgi:hypothetical protein